MASALPWLVALSEYKLATFGATAAALGYSWWRVREVRESGTCSVTTAKRLRFQNRVLLGASAVLGLSILSAYALLPLVMWFDDL